MTTMAAAVAGVAGRASEAIAPLVLRAIVRAAVEMAVRKNGLESGRAGVAAESVWMVLGDQLTVRRGAALSGMKEGAFRRLVEKVKVAVGRGTEELSRGE